MPTFTSNERSVQNSRPVELFLFTSQRAAPNQVVARSTSYHRDVVFAGQTYTKRTIRRGVTGVSNVGNGESSDSPTIEVLATDPAAVFYFGLAIPPQNFTIIVRRLQLDAAGVSIGNEDVFRGTVTDARQQGRTVVFTISEDFLDPLATKFPLNQLSTQCQHVLYDAGCQVPRNLHQVDTTISSIGYLGDIRIIEVADLALTLPGVGTANARDFRRGDFVHTPSGERRNIVHSETDPNTGLHYVTLDVRLPSSALAADAIQMWRGCARDIKLSCRDKFDNVANFGGDPFLDGEGRRSSFDRSGGIFKIPKSNTGFNF